MRACFVLLFLPAAFLATGAGAQPLYTATLATPPAQKLV